MTSRHESEANPKGTPAQQHRRKQTAPASSAEAAYERLSAYGFARRYARGKIVADLIHHQEEELGGCGLRMLVQSAESVTAALLLDEPPEVASPAAASRRQYSPSSSTAAPNVSYRWVDLSNLSLDESHFDVVAAFGVVEYLEHPEELVVEAKRLLKESGVFLISVPDKQTGTPDERDRRGGADGGRRAMYVPELRGLLERHFGHVRLYRQGAVAGGLVFPASKEVTGASAIPPESVRFSSSGPRFGVEVPTTRSVMGVCSDDAAALGEEERAYLLLERDRRVFDESEERAEDVKLLLDEIRRMQAAEVQTFLGAVGAQRLPLGVLLNLMPRMLLYYLYDRYADSREVSRRRSAILGKFGQQWETTLAPAVHEGMVAVEEAHHQRNLALAEIRRHRYLAFEEARYRRNLALEEVRHRRNLVLQEAHHRRNLVLQETRHRRNLAFEVARHRRNLALEEVRHRRNVTLEHIIHRRNIIGGNAHVIRQKGAKGMAKGAFRRLSVLYRRPREGQKGIRERTVRLVADRVIVHIARLLFCITP